MKNKILCAFSSDYRPTYIGDIYKALSMPVGYIMHFRYKKKYVEENILNSLNTLSKKDIVIFFTNFENREKNIVKENHAIRKAKLLKIEHDKDTELINIYFSLKEFVNIKLNDVDKSILPPNKYLVELEYSTLEESTWKSKIELLKDNFKTLIFYKINSIYRYNLIGFKFTKSIKNYQNLHSYYSLLHGKNYFLDISISNLNENKEASKLDINGSSADISMNYPLPITSELDYDNLDIPVYFKTLDVSSEFSFLTFKPIVNEDSDFYKDINRYFSTIEIIKKNSYTKAIVFGVLSTLVVTCIWLLKEGSDSITEFFYGTSDKIDCLTVASIIILLISSSVLFYKFNKK